MTYEVMAQGEPPVEKVSPSSEKPQPGDLVVQVNVATSFEPKEAVGLILSSSGVAERPSINLQKVKDGLLLVSFTYSKTDVKKDSFATAMVISANGDIAFGDVKALYGSSPKTSFYAIPQCPPDQNKVSIDRSKFGALETLVHYRTERRETYKKEIQEILSGPFLEKLKKLENGFGLTRGRPLSADLDPFELIDRLSRLKATVKGLTNGDAQ